MRRIEDAGSGVETADMNFRFYPALVAGLAYHIALKANVPIILCKLDYKTKTCGAFDQITPTGDFNLDMKYIEDAFKDFQGKNIENYGII